MSISSMMGKIWGPTRNLSGGGHAAMGAGVMTMFITMPAKFLGRTITIGAGLGISALALSLLAKTAVGTALGVTAFVATVSAWPVALTLTAATIATVGAGLTCSYLIEKHLK